MKSKTIALALSLLSGLTVASSLSAASAPVSFYPAEGNGNDLNHKHDAAVPVLDASNPGLNFTTGKVGQGFAFTGPGGAPSGTYVDFGNWFNFQSFTLAMWIKDGATAGSPQTSFATVLEYSGNVDFIWTLLYNNAANQYQWSSGDGAPPVTFSTTPAQWQHLVIARDGTSHMTTIYLNGQVVATATGSTDISYDFASKLRMGSNAQLSHYWKGATDEFRVYDRAITAQEVALLASTSSVDVVVPGSANPFLAGMPDGSSAYGDTAPNQSPVSVTGVALHPGDVLTFDAVGSTNYGGSTPIDPPDGSTFFNEGGANGISGCNYPLNSLVAVFLDDNAPNGSGAPATLDFAAGGNVVGGIDYTTISPELKQLFFLGDGATSSAAIQQVVVPAGATRLFLASTDGTGWFNNSGSYSVRVQSSGGGSTCSAGQVECNGTCVDLQADSQNCGSCGNNCPPGTTCSSGGCIPFTPMSISAHVTSTSDAVNGAFAHNGDDLVYTISFTNPGSSTAHNLRVEAVVPTHLHTDQTLHVSTTSGSATVTTTNGDTTAQLSVGGWFNGGTAATVPGSATITAIFDSSTFTISQPATGTATGTLNVVYGASAFQFTPGDLSISPGGTYVLPTSDTAHDGKIVWEVGDLGPSLTNFVRFTVHLSSKVRTEQSVRLRDDYVVYSTTNSPPGQVTGHDSGAIPVETHIEGPIKLVVTAPSATVAPGAQFTYHLALTNIGATTASHAVAVFLQPEFTRYIGSAFSNTPPPTKKKPKKGTPPPFNPTAKLVYVAGQTDPQVVLDIGPLTANQTVTIDLTFQAQWADPTEVPTLSTTDYAASFLTDAGYTSFLNNLAVAATVPDFGGTADFFAFVTSPTNLIAFSRDDSGRVDVNLQGSLTNAPELGLFKTMRDSPVLTVGDGQGNSALMVQPGGQLTCWIAAGNSGKADAADVYIQDRMPDHTTYVANSAQLMTVVDGTAVPLPPPPKKKPKKAPSPAPSPDTGTLRVVQDPDHHHLKFAGLKLPKQTQLMFQYIVQVDSGMNAPAAGTLINADDPINSQDPNAPRSSTSTIGSGSTPHTSIGVYAGNSIIVTGQVAFNSPTALPLIATPGVSHDLSATANILNSLYQANASALPLTNPSNPSSYVPGAQRYYFRYQNIGSVPASNVALAVPVPEHTAFYRASFVNIAADGSLGAAGEIIPTPATSTIHSPAFLSTGGTVSFTWQQLAASTGGYVMVEFIVSPDVVQQTGSLVGGAHPPDVVLQDNVTFFAQPRLAVPLADAAVENRPRLNGFLDFLSPHKSVAKLTVTPADDPLQIPKLGYSLTVPSEVVPGQPFDVQLSVMNAGEIGTFPIIDFAIPTGTTFVSANSGQGTVITPDQSEDGFLTVSVANNNGPTPNNSGVAWMPPHGMGVITVKLKATGDGGSDIVYANISDYLFYLGRIYAPASKTRIVNSLTPSQAVSIAVSGTPVTQIFMHTLTGTAQPVNLYDIGGGNIVAQGGGNIVAQGGGNIVAQGGGNIIAQGGGNILTVGTSTAGFLVQHGNEIVASGAGNILVPPGSSIVASGAGNIVAAGGGNIISGNGSAIVAQGGGNIVAQGGGNFAPPSAAIASLFGTGAGQIVAQGGGNIVAQGGGNIVAQGGGNIMTAGGGTIISTNGGAVHSSTPDSVAMIRAPGGQIISTDGNSIVAQGGGN
jgi:uncharacterized repeat protein (TIGR01451 family)